MIERPLWVTSLFILVFMGIAFFVYYWFESGRILEGATSGAGGYTYFPNTKFPNQRKDNVTANEFLYESYLVFDFIEVDNDIGQTPPDANKSVKSSANGPYTKSCSTLQIYKDFTNINSSTTITKNLDVIFGKYFKSSSFTSDSETSMKSNWATDTDPYNQVYNTLYYTVFHNAKSDVYNPTLFSDYFFALLKQYAKVSSDTQISQMKTFFYNLITPIYLTRQLFDLYVKNRNQYDKTDDAKDTILYVLSTTQSYMKYNPDKPPCSGGDVSIPTTVNTNFVNVDAQHNVYWTKMDTYKPTDTIFTLDSIKMFQAASILANFNAFVPNAKSINMDQSKFVSGFPEFLKKSYKNTTEDSTVDSVLVYWLDNPPVVG